MADYFEAELRKMQAGLENKLWLDYVIDRLTGRPIWKCQEV